MTRSPLDEAMSLLAAAGYRRVTITATSVSGTRCKVQGGADVAGTSTSLVASTGADLRSAPEADRRSR